MAAQARAFLLSDRRRMVHLFQSTELGRKSIEEFSALKSKTAEFADIGGLDEPGTARSVIELALRQSFDAVLPVLADVAGLNEVEIITVDSEAASASTRSFADGSQLVMVSDALMSLVGHLGELLAVWGLGKGRNRYVSALRRARDFERREELAASDPLILGGAAALRYYIQHQRAWALAAKVGTTMPRRKVLRNPDASLSDAALVFVVAHEMGHVVLGHTAEAAGADVGRQHQREIEADDFGFDIVSRVLGSTDAAAMAALIGLSAIAISTEPLFVRAPESHPNVAARLSNVMSRAPRSRDAMVHGWGLVEMVARAIETNVPLAQDCWDHMHERREFDTRHHTRQYFNIIQNFDIAIGFPPARTWVEVESLRDRAETEGLDEYERFDFGAIRAGLAHLERNESAAALRTWGVAEPEKIHDPALPMSYHALVSAVLGAAALNHVGDPASLWVRHVAVYMANVAASHLNHI